MMSKKAVSKKSQKQQKQKQKNKIIEQQVLEQDDQDEGIQDSDEEQNSQDSQQESGSEEDDESSSQSEVKVDPSKLAIKEMKFRDRRGTKMTYLMNRKKQQEDDPFWIDNKGYFGDLDGNDDDEQSYVQSSSGRDYFDSDFDQTQSEHNDQSKQAANFEQIDEEKQKEKKKRQQLMKKIKNPISQPKKEQPKSNKVVSKQFSADQIGRKYIHQVCTQEQLLGEAAHTQYFNWLSYRKLINIQTVKKDYSKKKHHIQGSKIIYRDTIMNNGERKVTYQLNSVQINSVKQLSDIWNA